MMNQEKYERCPECNEIPLLKEKKREYYIECKNYPECRYPTTHIFSTAEKAWKDWNFNARFYFIDYKSERGG